MRYSQLFGKTVKQAPHDADSVNARLLTQGGFVDQEMAGVYTWLPLGLATLGRVEQIVRQEMNALGANELAMPSLQPKEYWTTTGRWEGVDVLFKITSQTEKEYALGCSHEEVVTPLAQKFLRSYKELPMAVYQVGTKFRDELRAKSGVLRGREFRMKDMYSFHTTQESLAAFYAQTQDAYVRTYARCGLEVKVVQASGGEFTENQSHEFHALTEAGEDMLIACETCAFGQNSEVATYKAGDTCPKCKGTLAQMKGVEVGNIFDLGTKYSDAFGFRFTDEDGKQKPVLMGCYGIGTSRLVGAIVEVHHDDKGMIWPKSVAPFDVHVVSIAGKNAASPAVAAVEHMVTELEAAGIRVLWDDRDASPGEKFADADLIGIPLRLVVSEKTLAEEAVEWKGRAESEARRVPLTEIAARVKEWLQQE